MAQCVLFVKVALTFAKIDFNHTLLTHGALLSRCHCHCNAKYIYISIYKKIQLSQGVHGWHHEKPQYRPFETDCLLGVPSRYHENQCFYIVIGSSFYGQPWDLNIFTFLRP